MAKKVQKPLGQGIDKVNRLTPNKKKKRKGGK